MKKKILSLVMIGLMFLMVVNTAVADCGERKTYQSPGQCINPWNQGEFEECERNAWETSSCDTPDGPQGQSSPVHAKHQEYPGKAEKCQATCNANEQGAQQSGKLASNSPGGEKCNECLPGEPGSEHLGELFKVGGGSVPPPPPPPPPILGIGYDASGGPPSEVSRWNPATGFFVAQTNFDTPASGCNLKGKNAEKLGEKAGEAGKGGGIGEIGQLLSGVGAIMSGVAALMQADTAKKDHALKREQFEFDKWKYFNDQAKQDAQCGKNGVSPTGGKCQTEQPGSSTSALGFGFGDNQNTFCDDKGNCQDMTKIPKKSKLVFASIHMTFPFTGNMFSLIKGVRNGIEFFDGTGHVELDSNGVTQMDIYYKEGQPILDKSRQLIWLLLGSTTYYGSGTSYPDTYETNTAMWHLNSAVMTVTTIARDGDEFSRAMSTITGAQTYSPPMLTTGVSFNHFSLPDFQNAIDISENGGTFNILTRGFVDAAIYGFGGYFPFMSRNVLKGDTVIVKNKDIGMATGYILRDGVFSYLIMNLGGSAKVITENSKIIQDASGIPRQLSNREYALLYNEGSAFKSMGDKRNLVFS